MYSISGYFRFALLWAMIPLTVLAGRPVTGCTCADGQYMLVCMRPLFRGTSPLAVGSQGTPCEENCCNGQCSQPQCIESGQCGGCGPSVQQDTSGDLCCNPDSPPAQATAISVTFYADDEQQSLSELPLAELARYSDTFAAHDHIPHETGPPGGDLVISLRRLLV